MTFEEFAKYLVGKDFIQLVHAAQADSENRVLGQGIAYVALFLSEMMMQAVLTAARQP